MLSDAVKRAIAIIATACIFFVAYYGNYLPLRQSQAFIAALRNAPNIRNFEEFKQMYAQVFSIPSPIGREELVRNLASNVVGIIGSGANPAVVPQLIALIQAYYLPIIQGGSGMSFSQDFYVLGNLYQLAFIKTNDAKFLDGAKSYYQMGLERAPKRPQFLYGLLDVYRLQGDVEGVNDVSTRILALWPTDDRVREAVKVFMKDAVTKQSATNKVK